MEYFRFFVAGDSDFSWKLFLSSLNTEKYQFIEQRGNIYLSRNVAESEQDEYLLLGYSKGEEYKKDLEYEEIEYINYHKGVVCFDIHYRGILLLKEVLDCLFDLIENEIIYVHDGFTKIMTKKEFMDKWKKEGVYWW